MIARVVAAVSASLALAACAATVPSPATPAAEAGPTFVDLTEDYASLYDASANLTGEARGRFIREGINRRLPHFYTPEWRDASPERLDRFFAGFLPEYAALRSDVSKVSARFGGIITPAIADFETRVGPLPEDLPIYLIVSMGEFDGATRDLAGRTYLLFGADVIAQYYGTIDPRAMLQHELFHIYHGARFAGCDEIWCTLWAEGLATHAAQQLNPEASDAELLLMVPEPIRVELEANRQLAACETLARLDSTDSADRNALFSFERLGPGLPPRFGYLLGAWIAQDLGQERSLNQLAMMGGQPLREEIEASLRRMADCPGPSLAID